MKPFARALSLLCALALLLCGCQNANPGTTVVPTERPTVVPTATPAETDPPEATPEPTAEPTPEVTPEPTQPPFLFDRLNFPRLDGSTSTVPLGKAIASKLLGETPEQVADLIHFSRTTESFRMLLYGFCDLLISAEPAASIWEEKESLGFEWEMEPFAVDGLVFLVNKDNPIDSITIDQIRGIYTGEITNWSQIGGADLDIVPFQRNAEAGSQTAMLKLVMQDTPMMEPPTDRVIDSMAGLIEAVSSFDGSPAAIGYSVYYYANDMRMADGLKILKVEDVEPSADTLRSKEYPLLLNYYVLIKAGLEETSPTKQLFQWILSEEGQKLVAGQGYVSVLDVEPDPDTGKIQPVGSLWRLSEHYVGGDPIVPGKPYGQLLPYVGAIQYYTTPGGLDTFSRYLYGVCNNAGQLITAPVYNSAFYRGGFLVLERQITEPLHPEINQYFNTTVASPDGSLVKDLGTCRVDSTGLADTPLAAQYPDGTFSLLNADLEPAITIQGKDLEAFVGEGFFQHAVWNTVNAGPFLLFAPEDFPDYAEVYHRTAEGNEIFRLYVDLRDGSISEERPEGFPDLPAMPEPAPTVEGYEVYYREVDGFTGTVYYHARNIETGEDVLLNQNGALAWIGDAYMVVGGLVMQMEDDELLCCTWNDMDAGTIFRYYLASNVD